MLAGTIDTEGMSPTKAFVAKYAPSFPVGEGELIKFQTFGGWSPMQRTFVPFIFFIDKKGNIREQHMGDDQLFFSAEAANYRKTLNKLIAEPGPATAPAKPPAKAPAPAAKKKAS